VLTCSLIDMATGYPVAIIIPFLPKEIFASCGVQILTYKWTLV